MHFDYYVDSVNDDGSAIIKSYKDNSISIANTNNEDRKILGRLITDNRYSYVPVNNKDLSVFHSMLDRIRNTTIREFTKACLSVIPAYIFDIPASSSGKYHPASDLGQGGLIRHIISVAKMVIYLTEPEFSREAFACDEIDCMISAALLHDTFKSGTQMQYENNKNTKFEHPLLAANFVRQLDYDIDSVYRHLIADCINSHMGEWNTDRYDITAEPLPKPTTKCEKLVHMADYLASRRDLSMMYNNTVYAFDNNKIEKKKNFDAISASDIEILKIVSELDFDIKTSEEFGIYRAKSEIKDIWNSIISQKAVSTKQKKYLTFAKNILNNNTNLNNS